MTITLEPTTEAFVDRAAGVGAALADNATRHDADGTFVQQSFEAVRDSGLLAAAVPTELGGGGGTIRDIAAIQRELAHHCGSTALATSMHQHVVTFTAWRYRKGLRGAEATLRRVAEEGIVLVSTGGGDFTHPKGEATKVEGGYRVSGRKRFASQSTVGTVMSTMFEFDDPEEGRRVLNMAVPFASDGVTVLDNWNTLGMRGTASNDVVLEDVFVPDERVLANRPHGVVDGPLQVIASIAMPIICGVYLGVAEAAFDRRRQRRSKRVDDAIVQRRVGLMAHRLQVAEWALQGALDQVGDDPVPALEPFSLSCWRSARSDSPASKCATSRWMWRAGRPSSRLGDRALLPRHPGQQVSPNHARRDAGARRPYGARGRGRRCVGVVARKHLVHARPIQGVRQ